MFHLTTPAPFSEKLPPLYIFKLLLHTCHFNDDYRAGDEAINTTQKGAITYIHMHNMVDFDLLVGAFSCLVVPSVDN
jgi:hypothetical protein